ncbi:MAG TPA: CBS domain-containing protein [Firmicutes bacterium]|nr:CBS domain-containing protein [Bacillota bacterium]
MTNILFFLTPKKNVAYIEEDFSIRQTIEKLEYYHYSAIPIIDSKGCYIGTITEGDVLWYLKEHKDLDLLDIEKINVLKIKRRRDNKAISTLEKIENLFELAINQSFVPVVDDLGRFIGIVTRKAILSYFKDNYVEK